MLISTKLDTLGQLLHPPKVRDWSRVYFIPAATDLVPSYCKNLFLIQYFHSKISLVRLSRRCVPKCATCRNSAHVSPMKPLPTQWWPNFVRNMECQLMYVPGKKEKWSRWYPLWFRSLSPSMTMSKSEAWNIFAMGWPNYLYVAYKSVTSKCWHFRRLGNGSTAKHPNLRGL